VLDAEEDELARHRIARAHRVHLPPWTLALVEQRLGRGVLDEQSKVRFAAHLMEEEVPAEVKGGADGLPAAELGTTSTDVEGQHLVAHERL
jgi:hypothetical protein